MYVCICNNVTESDVHEAVRDGARTLECLADSLGVSTCCGQCAYHADECLQVALTTITAGPALPTGAALSEPTFHAAP